LLDPEADIGRTPGPFAEYRARHAAKACARTAPPTVDPEQKHIGGRVHFRGSFNVLTTSCPDSEVRTPLRQLLMRTSESR
jgi:hypothetical protein